MCCSSCNLPTSGVHPLDIEAVSGVASECGTRCGIFHLLIRAKLSLVELWGNVKLDAEVRNVTNSAAVKEVVLSSYDRTQYESHPYVQSHPDRLATLATLFGMKPKPVTKARILELACASGGNLIPMAAAYPESEFIGIDLSKKQVDEGLATIKELGLKNIELRHGNVMDVTDELGKFDYIIAHAIFSWVENDVREKVLDICSKNLAEQGVAYVSYNTYPGWHHRGMIRDMMLYHTAGFEDPQTKAAQARALLDFLSQSVPTDNNSVHGLMLKRELDIVRSVKDFYLIHDHLEEKNEPLYFYQFAEMAGRHDLQYLSEAEFSTMLTSNFPVSVAETLRRISTDIVRTEQYMDFVRNREFRQTLLCHKDVQLNRNITFRSVMPLYVSSPVKPLTPNPSLTSRETVTFGLPDGRSLSTAAPLVKAALTHLGDIWPQAIPFDELVNQARAKISDVLIQDSSTFQRDVEMLGSDIVTCYTVNLVSLRTQPVPCVTEVSDKPSTPAYVRLQCRRGDAMVTSLTHENVAIDAFVRHILVLLDGTRTRNQILADLVKFAKDGTLVVQRSGHQLTEEQSLRDLLSTALDEKLPLIAKAGLLEA